MLNCKFDVPWTIFCRFFFCCCRCFRLFLLILLLLCQRERSILLSLPYCVIMLKWWIHLTFYYLFIYFIFFGFVGWGPWYRVLSMSTYFFHFFCVFLCAVVIVRHIYFDFSCRNNKHSRSVEERSIKMFIAGVDGDLVRKGIFGYNLESVCAIWDRYTLYGKKIELLVFSLCANVRMSNFSLRLNAYFFYFE